MVCATCRQSDNDEDEEHDEPDPSHRRPRLHPEAGRRTVHLPSQEGDVASSYHKMFGRALIKDVEKGLLGNDSGRLQLKDVAWIDGSTPVHVEK